MWKSTDAGATWRALWHTEDSLNVGSLAISPNNPDILYCGTGEANLSADSYAGVGVYRSTDGGESWMLLAPSDVAQIPRRIGTIAIDPNNPQHLRLAGISYKHEFNPIFGGMYVSTNGGATWRRETFVAQQNHWCHAIAFHPTDSNIIYASFTAQGSESGIWRSTDGGLKWEHLTNGLPDPARFSRSSLAIAPSDPNIVYVLAADAIPGQNDAIRVLGVFRSDDGGDSWIDTATSEFLDERQMNYNNTIAVHPENADHVICGGVDLHLSTDGGTTWCKVTDWRANRGDVNYAHADHHALLFAPAQPDRLYDVNDGGMDVSDDGGRIWSNRSNGLAATMFYDLDVAQTDGRFYGGGTQDNGTNVTTDGRADNFFDITGGDGGWLTIDPTNAGHFFASIYFMQIFRYLSPAGWQDVSPLLSNDPEAQQVWMAYIAMDPTNPLRLFTGSRRVWRTLDAGGKWLPVSPSLDGSAVTAIEIAPADPQKIYVGTENGGFFRSVDGGQTWSPDLQSALLPGYTITRIASRPNDGDVVLATVANFGHSHLYLSRDGGVNWQDLDRGRLPDVPHHVVLVRSDVADTIYVGNDIGVWRSPDFGISWENITDNLPNANVVDLVYHRIDGTITAATYGRSLWRRAAV